MGLDRAKIEQMAVGQVIAVYSERLYERIADDYETLWYVPFSDVQRRGREIAQFEDVRPMGPGADREVIPIATMLLPALSAVRESSMRIEREQSALRVIEALRIYGAGHDGKLPAELAQITEVPVPPNPATGKPFVYRLEGATGILELPASDGIRTDVRRYEIKIVPSK